MFRDDHPEAWSFHTLTSRSPFNMHGLNPPSYVVPPFKELPQAKTLDLPEPSLPTMSLAECIRGRVSCRRFAADPLTLRSLSTLLASGYGVLKTSEWDGEFLERAVPSGGALYPLELYVLVQQVEDLQGGVWHYLPLGHRLEQVYAHPLPKLLTAEMFMGQPYLTECAAILFITSIVERSMWKYEDRGYRYILLEAGHVAQNLNLCAAAMDLGSLNLGGFFDRDVLNLLHADPEQEIALYGIAVGPAQDLDRMTRRRPDDEVVRFRRY